MRKIMLVSSLALVGLSCHGCSAWRMEVSACVTTDKIPLHIADGKTDGVGSGKVQVTFVREADKKTSPVVPDKSVPPEKKEK
ncbi:MAG: hypothetical protein JWM56_659 [Candidatus Peribacteria bacterium]|nr:hypothetical protein [Candidatus Peribacteria bacterium]